MKMAETKPNLNPSPISVTSMVPAIIGFVPIFHFPVRRARSSLPVLVTSGKADSFFIYHHTLFSFCQYLNRHFFNRGIIVNPLLSYPGCQRFCCSCCLQQKLSGEAAIVASGFFSRVTIAASPLNFRRKQQEQKKKTSGTQGTITPLGSLFISSTFEGGRGLN